jgi:hypothetical protein
VPGVEHATQVLAPFEEGVGLIDQQRRLVRFDAAEQPGCGQVRLIDFSMRPFGRRRSL